MLFHKINYTSTRIAIIAGACLLLIPSCKKLLELRPPDNSIATSQVFVDSLNASTAVAGVYSKMFGGPGFSLSLANGLVTEAFGTYGDELVATPNNSSFEFFNNAVLSNNSTVGSTLWSDLYSTVYLINASLEGMANSATLKTSVKNQFIGELKFWRSFIYFYLINLYGDVPYVSTSNYQESQRIPRTAMSTIYTNIEEDLKESKNLLGTDYAISKSERIRANKWAAAALLARAFLYQGKWAEAEREATTVIETSGLYRLTDSLKDVFLKSSEESILQLHADPTMAPYNITKEGFNFIPFPNSPLNIYLAPRLTNSFESMDLRRQRWIDSATYENVKYYFPIKYRTPKLLVIGQSPTEYYTILRLAEMYLIRAEARAQLNKLNDAAADLNTIRHRAGLEELSPATQQVMLDKIYNEWSSEYFAEFGTRYFMLKRTGKIDQVLPATKQGWAPHKKLLPLPLVEIQRNNTLVQNPGYN